LIDLRAKFLVFQTHQHLPLAHAISFFHTDPGHAAHHFRAHGDLVMRHYIT